MQVGQRKGKSKIITINFQIRKNQGISPFFGEDQGKHQLISLWIMEKKEGCVIFWFDFPENLYEL